MTKFEHYITAPEGQVDEMASYEGNIGFEEMVAFYKKADDSDHAHMDLALSKNDWNAFKTLIKKVVGVKLK